MNLHVVPSRPGRSRAVVSVALALMALVLGGCTGGEPDPEPSGSPSSSVTVSPTRSRAPERPAAMDGDDLDGAEAAASYFLALYAYAYHTGDLAEWKAMSHPECIFCSSVIAGVEELYASGGYETGGVLQVEQVVGFPREEGSEYFGVDIWFTQDPGVAYDATGEVTEEFDGESQIALFAISKPGGQWVVRGIALEPQP